MFLEVKKVKLRHCFVLLVMREFGAIVTSVNTLWEGNGGNKATTLKNKIIKITRDPKFSSQQLLVLRIPQ